MDSYYQKLDSPLGALHVFASKEALLGIYFDSNVEPLRINSAINKPNPIIKQLKSELKEYFAGDRSEFTIPLDIFGTEFQKRVWNALLSVPYAKTSSYQLQARKAKTKAIRALGSANGQNPFPILIPCHRILRSNGELGGYSGGVAAKQFLLDLEKNNS